MSVRLNDVIVFRVDHEHHALRKYIMQGQTGPSFMSGIIVDGWTYPSIPLPTIAIAAKCSPYISYHDMSY